MSYSVSKVRHDENRGSGQVKCSDLSYTNKSNTEKCKFVTTPSFT